jgi:hypothetical protein
MEAFQLPRSNAEWKLILRRPEIDLQMIRMLNAFTTNRAGDNFMQNCRGVHKMFLDKFGKCQNHTDTKKEYLQRRADEWTNLVEGIFTRKLEAQVTGEDFNDMEAMFKLQQFLRKTASVLNLP